MRESSVVKYLPEYAEAVRNICLETAGIKNGDTKVQTYILEMYCNCYIEDETAFVLLDECGTPKGYILCAENCEAFLRRMKPHLAKIEALGELPAGMAKAEMENYARFAEKYPAHLHIDILETFTGSGNGTKLMQTLLEYLKGRGIPGVMLGVSASNTRAVKFYEKNGFRVIAGNESAFTMGKEL